MGFRLWVRLNFRSQNRMDGYLFHLNINTISLVFNFFMINHPSSSFRNITAKVRGNGTAREGVHEWLAQRLTAIALAPLGLWFLSQCFYFQEFSHKNMLLWFSDGLNLAGVLALFTVSLYHGFLGIKVIIEDYIPRTAYRQLCLIFLKLGCGSLFIVGFSFILKIITPK